MLPQTQGWPCGRADQAPALPEAHMLSRLLHPRFLCSLRALMLTWRGPPTAPASRVGCAREGLAAEHHALVFQLLVYLSLAGWLPSLVTWPCLRPNQVAACPLLLAPPALCSRQGDEPPGRCAAGLRDERRAAARRPRLPAAGGGAGGGRLPQRQVGERRGGEGASWRKGCESAAQGLLGQR